MSSRCLCVFLVLVLSSPSSTSSMSSVSSDIPRILYITGQPSCGKTTLIKNMMAEESFRHLNISGFFTEEVLEGGRRVGFDVVDFGGRAGVLARKGVKSGPTTGEYTIMVDSFEKIALPSIRVREEVDLYVIDEIGRMELHSKGFQMAVTRLIESGKPIFGSIAAPRYGRRVEFCEELKAREDTTTINLKPSNRDEVYQQVRAILSKKFPNARY